MVKGQKLFSLDIEIIEKLQQELNASALINRLLIAHYDMVKTMSIDEAKGKYEELRSKMEKARAVLDEMAQAELTERKREERTIEQENIAFEKRQEQLRLRAIKRKKFDKWIENNRELWEKEGLEFSDWLLRYDN